MGPTSVNELTSVRDRSRISGVSCVCLVEAAVVSTMICASKQRNRGRSRVRFQRDGRRSRLWMHAVRGFDDHCTRFSIGNEVQKCRVIHGAWKDASRNDTPTGREASHKQSIMRCLAETTLRGRPKRRERPVVTAPIARERKREAAQTAPVPVPVRNGTRVVRARLLARRVVLAGDRRVRRRRCRGDDSRQQAAAHALARAALLPIDKRRRDTTQRRDARRLRRRVLRVVQPLGAW